MSINNKCNIESKCANQNYQPFANNQTHKTSFSEKETNKNKKIGRLESLGKIFVYVGFLAAQVSKLALKIIGNVLSLYQCGRQNEHLSLKAMAIDSILIGSIFIKIFIEGIGGVIKPQEKSSTITNSICNLYAMVFQEKSKYINDNDDDNYLNKGFVTQEGNLERYDLYKHTVKEFAFVGLVTPIKKLFNLNSEK
jgi:hypothetical protein